MNANPEKTKFFHVENYTSKITDDLKVIGTENKDEFKINYIDNAELRKQFKLLGTHSEAFHCDEVLATTMLLYTKEFAKSIIVRTRDQDMLD